MLIITLAKLGPEKPARPESWLSERWRELKALCVESEPGSVPVRKSSLKSRILRFGRELKLSGMAPVIEFSRRFLHETQYQEVLV